MNSASCIWDSDLLWVCDHTAFSFRSEWGNDADTGLGWTSRDGNITQVCEEHICLPIYPHTLHSARCIPRMTEHMAPKVAREPVSPPTKSSSRSYSCISLDAFRASNGPVIPTRVGKTITCMYDMYLRRIAPISSFDSILSFIRLKLQQLSTFTGGSGIRPLVRRSGAANGDRFLRSISFEKKNQALFVGSASPIGYKTHAR